MTYRVRLQVLLVGVMAAGWLAACQKGASFTRDGGAGGKGGSTAKADGSAGTLGTGGVAMDDGGPTDDGGAGSDSGSPVPVPQVTITIQRSGNGTVTGMGVNCMDAASCTLTVDSGSSLVLTANPGPDSNFTLWSGCTSANGPSCTLTNVTSSTQVTASFALKNANVIVVKDGNGTGTVTATWPGNGTLSCGATCSAVIPKGTTVTLMATPDTGSTFAWNTMGCTGTGACMITTGDAPMNVGATFTLVKETLTVTRTGNGSVTATGNVSCTNASCPISVNYGDSVTLTAVPGSDSDFGAWTGCTTMTGATCVVSGIKAAAAVSVSFKLKKIAVTIGLSGNGSVASADNTVSCTPATATAGACTVSVDSGTSLSLTATPGSDSDFKTWSGCTSMSGATCTLTNITAPVSASATFAVKNASFVISKQGNGSGTVTATWAGGSLNCGAACSANIPQGTVVTVQGTAAAESTLAFSGPCSGAGTCMVTVPAGGTTVVATFSLVKYVLTVQASGSGTVTGTGVNCTTFPCPVSLDSGTSIALTANPVGEYLFSSWSGGCSSTSGAVCNVTSIKAATAVTATFVLKKYPVTVQVSGNGTVSGSVSCASASCVQSFDSGSTLTLTANPGSDSDFKSWTGCSTTNGAMCTVSSLMAAATVTATFGLKNASFNIVKNGNGAGTVTASWAGGGSLNCGTGCSASIPLGTQVTVTATAQTGSTAAIAGCATNPCTVAVAAGGTTVTGTFTLIQYVLSVSLGGPTGTGSVLSSVGINCGSTCSALVNYGTVVSLSATAAANGVFTGWSGCTPTNSSPCSVTVTGTTNVTANFKRTQGAACGADGDCSTSHCVGSVCCGTACTGNCNMGCATGTCAPKAAKTQCGTIPGPQGPGIGTDVTLFCDGAGSCVAPTIDCFGFNHVSCPLMSNTCCVVSSSSSYVCGPVANCLDKTAGDFFSGHACVTAADCPTSYDCCDQGTVDANTGFWNSCVPTGTCTGTVQP
jgi:hypothetical protein